MRLVPPPRRFVFMNKRVCVHCLENPSVREVHHAPRKMEITIHFTGCARLKIQAHVVFTYIRKLKYNNGEC